MSKPTPHTITKHIEVKDYEYKGVRVAVKIDYDGEQISLVEAQQNSQPVQFKAKQWTFTGREVDYMAGWRNILKAMELAITAAEKDLREHIDAKAQAKKDLEDRAMRAIAKERGI